LPTISRSAEDFTRLEPSASGGSLEEETISITTLGAVFNNPFGLDAATPGQTGSQPISLDAIEQIQVATAPYDVTLGLPELLLTQLQNQGQMNSRYDLCFFRNQDLTGSKVKGEIYLFHH
jgi:hypothetical protein